MCVAVDHDNYNYYYNSTLEVSHFVLYKFTTYLLTYNYNYYYNYNHHYHYYRQQLNHLTTTTVTTPYYDYSDYNNYYYHC